MSRTGPGGDRRGRAGAGFPDPAHDAGSAAANLNGPFPDQAAPRFPRLDRGLGLIARACMILAGVQMVALVGLMGWLVFGRYVLNDTPTWVEQLAILLIAWITFIGAAVGVREDSHLSIDFVREALPPVPRAVLRVLSDLIVILFAGIMTWQGWKLVMTNLSREIPMLGLPEAWRAAPLVGFGVLATLFALARLAQRAPLRGRTWD